MLILGEPGAGKTTLLIELALSLVERAQNDNNSRIPVVLNISGWNNERSLREWLVLALRDLLGGTKDFAAQLAGGNNLLLLLDGLDEVTVKHRVACVQAINAYLSEYAIVPEIIVSCRSHEYSNIDAQLQIAGAIQLEPLDLPIVESILAEIPAAQGVLTALQTDALLRELATNPLMIQVLLLAHNSQNVPFAGANSVDERRKVLWSAYVKRMLQQRPLQQWNTTQTLRWLRWLAQILFEPKSRIRFFVDDPYHHFENDLLFDTLRFNQNKFEFNNFLIDHIQPTLLPSEQYYNRYSLLTNVTTSIISISSILIVSLIIFSITPVQNVILLVAFLILSLAICLRGDRDRIHLPIERRIYKKWSWRRSLAAIDPFNQRILPKDDDYIQFLIKMNKEIPGYTPKPILEFVSELISGFNRGWYIETIKSGNSPMQSFHIEMWHNFRKIPLDAFLKSIFVMLFLVLSITLAYVTDGGNISISSIGYLLIPALFYGIPQTFMIPRNLLQHYILRHLLFDAGSIPFRTVTFLEAMNERLLLGRNEASYYFRHALLREFFANLTDDQINELANQI